MLIKLLWISALWLGIGLTAGLCLWTCMSAAKRFGPRKPAPVRQVPELATEPTKQPFHALASGGGPKPMRLASRPVDRNAVESALISVPGSRR